MARLSSKACRGPLIAVWVLAIAIGAGCRSDRPHAVVKAARPEEAAKLNAQAVEQIDRGAFAKAAELLRKALAADANYGPAHNNLGLVFYQQSRLYDAAWEFERASTLMPERAEPVNNLGMVYERIGRLDEAQSRYEQALRLSPQDPEVIGNLARARIRDGDYSDDTRALLDELVLRDTRPQWSEWAQESLVRWPAAPTTAPAAGTPATATPVTPDTPATQPAP